jgi:glucosyl-3-phosphoglycerate synthase
MTASDAPWTLNRDDFDLAKVALLKVKTSVAVVIPAKNEADTIGAVLEAVRHHEDFVDELVVVDDHSNDDTATVAEHHDAKVIHLEGRGGKGEAMKAGLAATSSEIVVFLDADVLNTTTEFVPRLVQPLLERRDIELVKGY